MSLTANEIRQRYLDFFASQKHVVVPSSSILPENDPTTLFTGSGMQPMIAYLLGQSHPQGNRLTDSQKCFRSQDIEEVGDNRHTTFFEMLGNWSLGDYFKQEQIPWMWEFLTSTEKGLGLDPKNLYFTCFRGNEEIGIPRDTESAELWQKLFATKNIEAAIVDFPEEKGMQGGKIFYYNEKKNWWSRAGIPSKMPVGEPGGPDTEMFWDFAPQCGDNHLNGDADKAAWGEFCHVNCDCGRFMEIGNNVFMQYRKTETGFEELPQKNVDFGAGLERMAAAVRNDADVFTIDIFDGLKKVLEEVSGKKYSDYDSEVTKAFRVILDHLRAATFVIADGAFPSNKDQGYFTRRLIRRAVRYAHLLGVKENFAGKIAGAVVAAYAEAYPYLKEKEIAIVAELDKEETKFKRTITDGMKKFSEFTKNLSSGNAIPTEQVFDLYQSYGFPFEITQELAIERGFTVDETSFRAEVKKHQEQSRAGSEQKFKGGLVDHSDMSVRYHTATHLLHSAVLEILGPHAVQKGSNITPERLRFDFAHNDKLTDEELKKVEDLVNAAIERDYPVSFQIIPLAEARAKKAIGLFGDKYEEMVKVYTIGDPNEVAVADPKAPCFSREFCGGPHVEHTNLVGKFKILKEEAVSAGVRRIKAIAE
ncbi:MAG: alanine--tRNA ligase [Candidatus Magasanikbacteria bacterium]|nr:alanine--tRNA ligase [Candidatus Magasanikbacteria bacterium]